MGAFQRAADSKLVRSIDNKIFWKRSKEVATVNSGRVVGLEWTEGEPISAEDLRRLVKQMDQLRVPNSAPVTIKMPGFLDGDEGKYTLSVKG
jgi:hypothetical protein